MSGRRVLVVDDNVDSAAMIAAYLRLVGHDVRTAHTGGEALAIAANFTPEVVIVDVRLPDLDGLEVARRLRAAPDTARARIMTVSGLDDPETAARARELGVERYLLKPVDVIVLERLITDPDARG